MSTSVIPVERAYAAAFGDYLAHGDEAALRAAYELGREAVMEQLSVLELAGIHHRVLASSVLDRVGSSDIERITGAGADFFIETMSAFEMLQRGFREATETARLEKEHVDQLRQLTAASLAIHASLSLEGILHLLMDRSRELTGARCGLASVVVGDRRQVDAEWIRCSREESHRLQFARSSERVGVGRSGRSSRRSEEMAARSGWDVGSTDDPPAAALFPPDLDGLAAPLVDRDGQAIGVIHLFDKTDGAFSESDGSRLAQLAHVASVAIENAQLYERERQIGLALQRRLLPARLPEIPGLSLEARYVPGGVGVLVGGDWYDVIRLPDDEVGVAVGDVMGRGASAASVMGQVRAAFRAYAVGGEPPEVVVGKLNDLIQTLGLVDFSTMVYLVVNPSSGRASMVRAGHPPPLLVHANGGTAYLDGGPGMALGVSLDPGYEPVTLDMDPGALLLLYTDGLVESKDGLDEGFDRLERVARGLQTRRADLSSASSSIIDQLVGANPEDDAALLMLRRGSA